MSGKNKLFESTLISDNSYQKSKMRYNRDYMISPRVAKELNTYNYFGIFKAFNDVHKRGDINPETGEENKEGIGPNAPAVRSLFNRSAAMMVGGTVSDNGTANTRIDAVRKNASEWRVYNNVPLLDSPDNRREMRKQGSCTVKELVQQSSEGLLGRATYSYADFMYCKYLGRVPNNYLITLRRFPVPPGDNITAVGTTKKNLKGAGKNNTMQQIGCLVTWMGTPGNEMENLLKYSVTMPYQEKQAKMDNLSTQGADDQQGVLNGIAAAFDSGYRKQYNAGQGGAAFNSFVSTFFPPLGKGLSTGPYPMNYTDNNKVYGPIDRVKKIYMRGDEGIDFKQNITLTFEYELRSYNGINTRQAFLDLLANILSVTYTTGSFWGGGYRGGGMHQNSIFNNLNIFKAKGGFTDFVDAFQKDVETFKKPLVDHVNSEYRKNKAIDKQKREQAKKNGGDGKESFFGDGVIGTIMDIGKQALSMLNSIGGMFLGGMLNRLGRPARAYADSLLSERPTGMWHVMIGNPKHPIMSMGNMVLKNTTIQHYGPLGLDDFPTYIKVVCELDRGKGRDNRDIESLYMHGNDRIYSSMSQKVLDMYNNASQYKADKYAYVGNDDNGRHTRPTLTTSPPPVPDPSSIKMPSSIGAGTRSRTFAARSAADDISSKVFDNQSPEISSSTNFEEIGVMSDNAITGEQLRSRNDMLQKYYGETDTYSICFSAAEQEYGATPPKTKKDSSTKEPGT